MPESTHAIRVPHSNTRAAKQMRTCLVMAVLARSLTKHIFTPTYIFEDETEMKEVLLQISDKAKKEFLRGMIMSLFEDRQKKTAATKVSEVVREVLKPVQELIGLSAAQKFGQELRSTVRAAKDMWWLLQRHRSHFEANMLEDGDTLAGEIWEWQSVRFSNESDQMKSQAANVEAFDTDEAVLTLFPRIFVVEDSEDIPIFAGAVLQKSQTVSAEREVSEMDASSPIEGKQGFTNRSTRGKRLAANGASGKSGRDDEKGPSFLGSRGSG